MWGQEVLVEIGLGALGMAWIAATWINSLLSETWGRGEGEMQV